MPGEFKGDGFTDSVRRPGHERDLFLKRDLHCVFPAAKICLHDTPRRIIPQQLEGAGSLGFVYNGVRRSCKGFHMSVPTRDVRAPVQLPSTVDRIIVAAQYPNITPELLFDYFVRPGLVMRWWAPKVEIHARQGGTFHFAWEEMDLHLRGQYTFVERGRKLAFTWKWDHEKRAPRSVSITFEPCANGVMVTVVHKPYSLYEQQERKHHAEAWQYYLEALQKLTQSAMAS